MSPESVTTLLRAIENLSLQVNGLQVTMGRLEERVENVCKDREQVEKAHDECRADMIHNLDKLTMHVDKEVDALDLKYAPYAQRVDALMSWGKALVIIQSAIIFLLGVVAAVVGLLG